MITQTVWHLLSVVASHAISLLPAWTVPDFVSSIPGYVTTLSSYTAGTDAWLPWSTVGVTISAIVAAVTLAVTIHLSRKVLSLFTGGGGA